MWKTIGKLLVKYGPGLVEALLSIKHQQDAEKAEKAEAAPKAD